MTDKIASAGVVIAALIASVIVDIHGGDTAPYLGVASVALGYLVGHSVERNRSKKI